MAPRTLLSPLRTVRVGLLIALAGAAALIVATLVRYPLDPARHMTELVGSLVALAVLAGLDGWIVVGLRRYGSDRARLSAVRLGVRWGLIFGALWVVEIGYNNLIAPPVAVRDPVDDLIWTAIALGMLVVTATAARRGGSIMAGLRTGFWSGLVSGVFACLAALVLVVFGMRFLLADPANIAEYAERGPAAGFSNMAAYLAYQTLAGAMLHLVVLGMVMGALLGGIGGIGGVTGRALAAARRHAPVDARHEP